MKSIYPLENILKLRLGWNQARIQFLSQFLIALIGKASVNLKKIAKAFRGKAQILSNYRRINRFFAKFVMDYNLFSNLLVSLFD